ncbi:MAG: iron-containing redox enzyme family protein [Acidimicrobiia bacterium]|nr:iron-containing redox enzyme family protein [Acidimicrobiia bacterium]
MPERFAVDDPWGDDLHLALYCCYELHYRSFAGVGDGWEWHPPLLAFRAGLEEPFEAALRQRCDARRLRSDVDVVAALGSLAEAEGPSLSTYLATRGTLRQFREFVVHRSPYQLKEADPHTWAIPRLEGAPKAAVIQVQMEEYGDGVEATMHSTLFADTMAELLLDPTYGRYLDFVPGTTLATTNLISMCGLHRRLRGALVGHLALFEMTSVGPMGRYSAALERFGASTRARRFYDVHIEADEAHAEVAAHQMAGRLAVEQPRLAADIVFGAEAANLVEGRFAAAVLEAWEAGHSSLRAPLGC